MSRIKAIIKCPSHSENTASCVVYSDAHYYCYGCGSYGWAKDIGYDMEITSIKEDLPKEDVKASLERIRALPIERVRGLDLYVDETSYYLVWPNAEYYIRRFFEVEKRQGKYRCPTGIQRPPYFLKGNGNLKRLYLVEGELNALSLSLVHNGPIVSPGSATEFKQGNIARLKPIVSLFDNVTIVCDNDDAGVLGAIEAKAYLTLQGVQARIRLVEPKHDFNDLLQELGQDGFRQWFEENMEM